MSELITDKNELDQYLTVLGADGKDFIIDLIDTCIKDLPKQAEILQQSHAGQDPDTFRRAAHTLKSNCRTMGAPSLADQFLELESKGELGEISDVSGLMDAALDQLPQLIAELEAKTQALA